MLVGIRSAILSVTAQAKLVGVCHAQIIASWTAVRVVTVPTTHLSFTKWVMVRQAHLSALRLMTFQAGLVCLPGRLHNDLSFWNEILDRVYPAGTHQIETCFFRR